MPDTFYSWFLVTELHVWLLGVIHNRSFQIRAFFLTIFFLQSRLMGEGDEGRIVRNAMVEALWIDCDNRAKVLSYI